MLTDLVYQVTLFICGIILGFVFEAPFGFIFFCLCMIANYHSPFRWRISLAYVFFLLIGASVADSAQFILSMATGQISDPPLMTPMVWGFLYGLYFIATIVINLIPTELILKRRYPQGHRHYYAISISAVVFLNLISWAIVFYWSKFSFNDSVLFYLVWAPGLAAGLGVFNYIMQKVPPRSLAQTSTPKGSNSASSEIGG